MTDTTPAGPAPKRTPAKTTAAKAPTAKAPTTKAPAAKAPATKTTAAKAPAAKVAAAKAPVTKTTAVKASAAKAPAAKTTPTRVAPAKTVPAKSTLPPVEPPPATAVAAAVSPAAATAPAGWYPVAAGSAQQRWWDGARWTEHVYEPPTAARPVGVAPGAVAQQPPLRAPAGTKPGTVWFWLIAIGAPILTILSLVPTSIYLSELIGSDLTDPNTLTATTLSPAYLLVLLSGWFIDAVCIVFALLDWRALKARGVPKPFHWAWSFFVIAVGWPAVYVIGRTVVVKRRTGSGMAPLWVFIGLEVVAFIVSAVVFFTALAQFLSQLSYAFRNFG